MRTEPIIAARIDFGTEPGAVPRSAAFDDVYHPRIGALVQARHVFLQGNGLPARWGGRSRFVILETGFGLGNNFLATWDAWRADPARCERLFFVSIERHPPCRNDLARAHAASALPALAAALVASWPPLTPNLHTLEFDNGRVQLLLALGDVAALLPGLRLTADAFYLDGFAPARNPAMWQPRVLSTLGRKAAPDATLATWSVARELRDGLATAGFEVERAPGIGGKREITRARHAPRHAIRGLPALDVAAREAVVVGAGIAGACAARALARLGLEVTVIEQEAGVAAGASGNPAGLFHGTVHGDDGPYARLYRAAALQARLDHGQAMAASGSGGCAGGLLRLDGQPGGLPAMRALLARLGLPVEHVEALDALEAGRRAGVPLAEPAWYYPAGGWLSPAEAVRAALQTRGVRCVTRTMLAGLMHDADGTWRLFDARGRELIRTSLLVLANAAGASALLAPLGVAAWPLGHSRGQVTYWGGDPTPLRLPVAGDGYAIPLPQGGLLCGATRDEVPFSDDDAQPRDADHRRNVDRLQRLTGLRPPSDPALWQGRVGWRLQATDRLPIAGAVAQPHLGPGQRADQARLLPRLGGLFVLTALGSRGLTLAPLLGRLLAAQATGTPWPLEQDLADAIDPARWQVRAARGGGAVQPAG